MKQSLTQFLIEAFNFEYHDNLNPKLWSGDSIKPKIRQHLLKIAKIYFESLNLSPDYKITDVVMTGSSANFNYTRHSDLDIHVMIDKNADHCKVVGLELMDVLKSKTLGWNQEHDIKVFGYSVEVYTQLADEPHHSTGVYSLQNDEWVTRPVRKKGIEKTVNEYAVNVKAKALKELIDSFKDVSDYTKIKEVRKKIKNMRQAGLERGGEFSTENLVFKELRNAGYLDKLQDYYLEAFDKSLSLK
jgi:hypothetical protein